jgi:amino acid transporter
MNDETPEPLLRRIKRTLIGGARSPREADTFHKISLIAFFAWIGLGADGLSSSCYGPSEAFVNLQGHPYLGMFVALATAVTIFVIATSYSQIIELFPSGGGGYLVASKLLSPRLGMLSGCALMVDYVLTIAVSVASGTDALFSFFPQAYGDHKLMFAAGVVVILTLMNLRGVRESIGPLVPIFLVFVFTHAFVIVYSICVHAPELPGLATKTMAEAKSSVSSLGIWGTVFIIMHAYSMGAGTFTGIEAVSNGLPILRDPKVKTGKRTMHYMWISLAVTVTGLMIAYLLFNVQPEEGKTLNAVLLERMSGSWSFGGPTFVIVTLVSEAALLFVAAQTGFLGGPRVLANMAADRWFPTRLSMLSERLVTHNGIIIMGLAAVVTVLMTRGAIEILVVLYSINVFITFALSQTGMVRHWWASRKTQPHCLKKLFINGVGLVLTLFILVWIVIFKFNKGGWITLLVTGALVLLASLIKRHYNASRKLVEQFNSLAMSAMKVSDLSNGDARNEAKARLPDPSGKTAVLLVNDYNGMGVHSLMNIFRFFGESFKNYIFAQVGVIDTENFKGVNEVANLERHVQNQVQQYVQIMRQQGCFAEAYTSVGADIVDEIEKLADQIVRKYPQAVFFAGQLLFPHDSVATRLLHNNITFALQRRLYHKGIPFMLLPIRVMENPMSIHHRAKKHTQ